MSRSRKTARHVAVPLTARRRRDRGELLLVPADGVSRRVRTRALGLIAGVDMFSHIVTNMTLRPALIKMFAPPGEASSPGFPVLAPVDEFLDRHRKPVLIGTLVVVIGALPLLTQLHFDFNPLHLKDPHSESMATLDSIKNTPEGAVNNVAMLAPTLADANRIADKLRALPQVGSATTLSSLIPDKSAEEARAHQGHRRLLLPVLDQQTASPVTDEVRVAALKRVSSALSLTADDHPGPGANEAKHLSQTLTKLAQADAATRDRADHAMADPLRIGLAQLRALLTPTQITRETLPPSLADDLQREGSDARVGVAEGAEGRRAGRRHAARALRGCGTESRAECDPRANFGAAFGGIHHQGVPAGRALFADHDRPAVVDGPATF